MMRRGRKEGEEERRNAPSTHQLPTPVKTTECIITTLPGSLQSPANDGAAWDSEEDVLGGRVHQNYGVSSDGQHALHLYRTAHVFHLAMKTHHLV